MHRIARSADPAHARNGMRRQLQEHAVEAVRNGDAVMRGTVNEGCMSIILRGAAPQHQHSSDGYIGRREHVRLRKVCGMCRCGLDVELSDVCR